MQVFPGTAMAGNVTLKDHSVIYRVRVSAAIMSDKDINEGDLSSFTDNATIFVPEPGIYFSRSSYDIVIMHVYIWVKPL